MNSKTSKIGYVILHYMSLDETQGAVESIIKNAGTTPFEIVIVDNASPNDSGQILFEYYKGVNNIHVILNKTNLGFARGNNVGFLYAKEKLCDFICLMNNDSLLLTKNFGNHIVEKYNSHPYWVLGPDILSPSGSHRNPHKYAPLLTIYSVNKELFKMYVQLILNYLRLDGLYKTIKNKIVTSSRHSEAFTKDYYEEDIVNVPLAGAFLIFSPDYISKFNGLNGDTFLFREEDILFYLVRKADGILLYSPDIQVFHIGQVTTNKYSISRKKNITKIKYHIQSLIVLKRCMTNN